VIWVYAIAERPEAPPTTSVIGVAGVPLESVREGRLLAVFSRQAELPEVSTADALWAHEQVVERLMAERAVLPMRFGSRLPGEGALRRALAACHDELLGALDRVRGRVELAVRVVWAEGAGRPDMHGRAVPVAVESHDTGREYVRAKLELRKRAEAAGAAVHAPLAALAVAQSRRPGRGPGELMRASYLVERPAVAAFQAAAQRLQDEDRDTAVLCTGPWPPYSFVDVAASSCVEGGRAA
jgi:hypothetical protein